MFMCRLKATTTLLMLERTQTQTQPASQAKTQIDRWF